MRRLLFSFLFLLALPLSATEEILWEFPRDVTFEKGSLIIHAPQVIEWPEYETASLLLAVEFLPNAGDEEVIYATVEMTGSTEVDMEERTVRLSNREVIATKVSGVDRPEYTEALTKRITATPVVAPLDIFLLSLAQDVMEVKNHEGFNPAPPNIIVAMSPTILLSVPGEPQFEPMESSAYSVITNANWPLMKHRTEEAYYLLYKNSWWQSTSLEGDWTAMVEQPEGIDVLDPEGAFKDFLVTASPGETVQILFAKQPTELILLDGAAITEAIPEALGLSFTTNTQSPLFQYGDDWYFLAAGRWFMTDTLEKGGWEMVTELPEVFSEIPASHGMGYVRASVAGTVEAKTALLEANLPQKKTVSVNDYLELTNQYDGEPSFERIASTKVVRATNSPYDIFEFQGVYYLCYEGVWYDSDVPEGPWKPALRVPDVIYDIPADSPAYPVTQVAVSQSSSTTVTYSASSSYYTGVYSYYGFPVYGTGWYYPPYYGFGALWYYPWYRSYGYGSFYNPRTGNYGTRQVWAGPYGGYSYNQHYSPRTGRSGYVETAWDSDEWASYGETYNPRTNIYTETERYYSDDHERFEMEREISRGDKTMNVDREVDIDDGWAVTERSTSEGGNMRVERHRQEDGSYTSDGTINSGDGKSVDFEGKIEDGQRRTHYEGSEGGEFVTGGDGENRGMVGKGSDGSLYAGKNGDVYKKSGDSWYQYDRENGWGEIPGPSGDNARDRANEWQNSATDRAGTTTQKRERASSTASSGGWDDYNRDKSSRMSQLSRDAHARNMGNRQFQQRRSLSRNRMSTGRMRSRYR